MFFLVLSIFFSSALFIIFKLFDVYKINTLQAIVVNYFTAFMVGVFSYHQEVVFTNIPKAPWFYGALILSFLFISVFNLMALTSQRNGVSVAAVAGKMSIIVPVIFGVYLYQENLNAIKITGIVLALLAVYLTTSKDQNNTKSANYLFPALLFIGSGIIDTTIKYVQDTYVPDSELPLFSATVFCLAGILGVVSYFFQRTAIHIRNIIAGIILGVFNYYSIYYLLKALDVEGTQSSEVFTINNVAIVMFTTLIGLLLFKEKLLLKNWIGIGIAIISILLITL